MNDGDFAREEIEVLLELAMVRYQRRFGEVLFRPTEFGWPNLVPPLDATKVVPSLPLISEPPHDLHRIKTVQLVLGGRPDIHPSAIDLVDKLEAMIEEDRERRLGPSFSPA